MSHWQSGWVEANGIRLHYTRTGEGARGAKPPLVLVHGFSDDGLCWTPEAQALEEAYDVIMVDARGHGRSDAPEQGYTPTDHAADVAGLIRALTLQRPAVLGHSMGAATTLTLAGTYPDVPGAVLLEDPPAWWVARPDDRAAWEQRWAGVRARLIELKRKTREELIAEQRAVAPGWTDAMVEPWADSKLRVSFNVLNNAYPETLDWPALVRRITCPVLLIRADPALGGIVTAEDAAALEALVPTTRVAHIPGAGHAVRRDQFERYIEAVHAFLRETVTS